MIGGLTDVSSVPVQQRFITVNEYIPREKTTSIDILIREVSRRRARSDAAFPVCPTLKFNFFESNVFLSSK